MNKEFVPYEQVLALKEIGYFNNSILGNCISFYGENRKTLNIEVSKINCFHPGVQYENYIDFIVGAPLYQQAFRWFREKYQIDSWIYPNLNGLYSVSKVRRGVGLGKVSEYQTYEEAELECLKKLIEICKNKG